MNWSKPTKKATATLALMSILLPSAAVANAYLNDAKSYYTKGEVEAATIQLKNLLRDEPNNAEGRLLMGKIHMQAGRWPAAEKELVRASELGAPSEQLTPLLAETFISMQAWDRALNLLMLDWTAEMPQQEKRWALIGSAKLGEKNLEEAENAFYRSIQEKPNDMAKLGLALVAQSRGQLEEALKELSLIKGDSREALRAGYLRAELLRRMGRAEEAFTAFTQVIKDMPDNLGAHLGRAQSGIDSGQLEQARLEVDMLLKKAPNTPDVQLVAGLLALAEKNNPKANEHAQMLLQMAPNNPQALMIAGAAAFYANDLTAATSHLQAVVEQVPGHMLANRMLADALLRQNQPERVLKLVEPLLAQGLKDGVLKAIAGNAHIQRGDLERGAQLLDEAANELPASDKITTQRALTRLLSGRSSEALDLLSEQQDSSLQGDAINVAALMREEQHEKAFALIDKRLQTLAGPNATPYVLMKGLLQQRLGDNAKAEQTLLTATKADPTNPAPWLALSRLAMKQNDAQAGESHLHEALKREPDNIAALLAMASLANQQNDHQKATEWLNRAKKAHPKDIRPIQEATGQLVARGLNENALNTANHFYLENKEQADAALLFAKLLRLNKQRQRAIEVIQPHYNLTPEKRQVALLLATLLKESGDFSASLRITQRLIDQDGSVNPAGVLHAETLLLNKEYSAAEPLLEQLWEKTPQPIIARLRFVHAYSTAKWTRAEELAQHVYPEQHDAQLLQMLIGMHIQTQSIPAAEAFLEKHLSQFPDDGFALMQSASLAHQQGKTTVAIQRFEQLREQQPNNPIAWNNLAWIYETENDSRSLTYAREANRLAPDSPDIKDTLGWILLRNGKVEEAHKLLKAAHEALKDNSEVTLHFAEAILAGSQPQDAEPLLKPLLQAPAHVSKRAQALLNQLSQ